MVKGWSSYKTINDHKLYPWRIVAGVAIIIFGGVLISNAVGSVPTNIPTTVTTEHYNSKHFDADLDAGHLAIQLKGGEKVDGYFTPVAIGEVKKMEYFIKDPGGIILELEEVKEKKGKKTIEHVEKKTFNSKQDFKFEAQTTGPYAIWFEKLETQSVTIYMVYNVTRTVPAEIDASSIDGFGVTIVVGGANILALLSIRPKKVE